MWGLIRAPGEEGSISISASAAASGRSPEKAAHPTAAAVFRKRRRGIAMGPIRLSRSALAAHPEDEGRLRVVFLSRPQDGRGEARLVRGIGEVLGLQAQSRPVLVHDAALALDRAVQ